MGSAPLAVASVDSAVRAEPIAVVALSGSVGGYFTVALAGERRTELFAEFAGGEAGRPGAALLADCHCLSGDCSRAVFATRGRAWAWKVG